MELRKDIVMRKVAGNSVIIPADDAKNIIRLNSTGSLILEGIRSGLSEKEIVGAMVSKYDVETEKAKEDVYEFLECAKEAGLFVQEECDDIK